MEITIVGGGFGGVKAALALSKSKTAHITLISNKTDFQYYPALYSTVAGHSHLESWVPLKEIFAGRDNVDIVIDTITTIDKASKNITATSGATYHYHTLILALGSVTTYFGIEGLDHYAYGIKSAAEIATLKQHLLKEFSLPNAADKHFMVVGAGPTGVELASVLGTYLLHLQKHYKKPEPKISITLIEAAPRVLPRMSEGASKMVERRLEKLGVHVELSKRVETETADSVIINGKTVKSHTVIWTSGVANHPFFAANANQFEFAKNHKIVVDDYLRSSDHVYVIGDNAATPFSGLAQTAIHDGVFVARHLLHKTKKTYVAKMPLAVVPVGKNWAIFEHKKLRFAGIAGSLIRRAADFVGYTDILPVSRAIGVWRAQSVIEDDYFIAPDALKHEIS